MLGDEFFPDLQFLCVGEDVDIACGFNEGIAEVSDGIEAAPDAKGTTKGKPCYEVILSHD